MATQVTPPKPADDIRVVVESQIKCASSRHLTTSRHNADTVPSENFISVRFLFSKSRNDLPLLSNALDIYFHQKNKEETAAALALRNAILRLRHQGVFVAVPLAIVHSEPHGPHPVGGCLLQMGQNQ